MEVAMNKLVSIVIPVYNVEEYLHDCFYSVMNQKYTNLQIIAVNDGSTDNSLNILNEFSRQDKRIEVYSKKNGGLSDARNFGLKHIKGDYISFVDSDDVIDKDMISTLVNNIENYDADISVCGYTFVFNDKKFVKDKSCEVVVLNSEKSLDMLYDSNKYGNFV